VIVQEDGMVKVLDFGLAKVAPRRSASDGDDPERSPIISMAATQAGVILGTAAYMAPEQARGKAVDKRADMWGFGVMFYEMVTGQRLFKGEDLTETLASVVKTDPDFDEAPQELHLLLRKCLEKKPVERLRDIGDWKALLDAGMTERQLRAEALSEPDRRPSRLWLWPAVATFLVIIAGVGLLGIRRNRAQRTARPARCRSWAGRGGR
jgi:serine/threonine protein kinase